jgi:hypothetical protein
MKAVAQKIRVIRLMDKVNTYHYWISAIYNQQINNSSAASRRIRQATMKPTRDSTKSY